MKIAAFDTLFTGVLDLLVPRLCAGCSVSIPGNQWCCESCRETIDPGLFVNEEVVPELSGLRSVWRYDGVVRSAIDNWKFKKLMPLGALLIRSGISGDWLQKAGWQFDSIISVPSHGYRMRERGFDPANQIAQYLSGLTGTPYRKDLYRRHDTRPQVGSLPGQRQKNVQGAFGYRGNKYSSVLIVDDVVTTGSTLREIARVLHEAQIEDVFAITLASAGGQIIQNSQVV